MRKKLVFCFLLSAFVHEGRAEVSERSEELTKVQSGIKAAGENLQRIQLQKNTLNSQLGEVEKLYGRTAALLKTLQAQVEQKRQNLSKIHQEKQSLQDEVAKQNVELAGQIKAAYAMGQKEQLKLLLNQQDPALSSRMLVYYDYLNKARLAKLANISESMHHLERLGKQQQHETELLEKSLEQKKSEQIAVDDVKKRRAKLLAQLKSDFSSNEQQIIHLRESENKLRNLVSSLQRSTNDLTFEVEQTKKLHKTAEVPAEEPGKDLLNSKDNFPKLEGDFFSFKGRLPWPVKGRLTNKFGSVRAESTENIWDGVLIDASEGTEIHAITSGKVVFSDWLRGYGLLIIIDHGKGYMTLYAFNQSLYRQVGEWVDAGEVVASVGQSGGRSRPGLYFGIRNNGKPVDPLEWCRK
ncbi:MAG: peptidoglycan DD-metalloendopeptidase family protein [Methylobacter sp.]|jgi:septal ring factor EnvC (AmiA/AmiB activator)|uniref:murein hydrolase activator EnvC family protein n=1 Tax=Methylobacter sp. TaxID=2051955 RepID=UPI0025EB4B01|nr:peptidoglycan DD-metalloendopeptidase family protein [Methylobacter sp.]MCK9619741.1 peptidoglycan DD-metalloendopeptidase family protein [Methylobacter sp.]